MSRTLQEYFYLNINILTINQLRDFGAVHNRKLK